MQRFFTIIGVFTVAFLMILGLNSLLPQGGFIVLDGERIGTREPGKPAIKLPVVEDHSSIDIEHEPHELDYTDPVLFSTEIVPADYFDDMGGPSYSKIHVRSMNSVQDYRHPKSCSCCENTDTRRRSDRYDGLEGAQDFWHATQGYDNIRDSAHRDDLIAIVASIRYAEGGSPSLEYGVKTDYARGTSPRAKATGYSGYRLQVGACAYEVQRRWDEYLKDGNDSRDMYGYIDYLGARYCPTEGASDDPHGLNHNWTGNVRERYDDLIGN
jgi:hypothetical protein